MLKELVSNLSNTELTNLVKDLKKNEKNNTNVLDYSKNFRYLLSEIREVKEISLQDYIGNLDYDLKNEIVNRIVNKKMIIY